MTKRWHLAGAGLLVVSAVWGALHARRPTAGLEQPLSPSLPVGPAGDAPGEILVDLRDDISAEQLQQLEQRYGIDLVLNSVYSGAAQLTKAHVSEARLPELIERLRREPLVVSAERNGVYSIQGWGDWGAYQPDDPLYKHQWHLDQIHMPDAWRLGRGRGAVVAVIDTGVAYADRDNTFRQVPDLAGTGIAEGYDFVDDDRSPLDEHGHGTHVAGTIAQTTGNGIGVAGVAFEARIMPLRVLNRRGFGSYGDIADAIRYAADHGADVINMSLGGPLPSLAIWNAVRYARGKGVVVVAAAGNTGRRGVQFPGALSQVIGVSATRYDEELSWYSSWGPQVDLAAPGGDTRVDQNGDGMVDGVLQNTIVLGNPLENDYLLFNGTSMASPHVAGVAALLVAEGVTQPATVERVMERTARGEGRDQQRYGAGIVDAAAALRHVQLTWGAWQLLMALGLAIVVLGGLHRAGRLERRPGLGLGLGLVMSSSGLFFLPQVLGDSLPEPLMTVLSHPLMAWDLALLGPGGHANPLFYSSFIPLAAALLFLGVRWLRGVIAGVALGGAVHLLFSSLWGTVDVTYLPWAFLDHLWLWSHAGLCLLVGLVVLRRQA